MASTTPATTSTSSTAFLSSPRGQRTLMVISGVVLAVGLAVFLGAYFGLGTSQDVHARSNDFTPGGKQQPVNVSVKQVPASPVARSVAREFLETAVARKNLATAYAITGPFLKDVPRAEWIKGTNSVASFPAAINLKTAPLKVVSSTKNDLSLEVGPLVAPKGTTIGGRPSLAFKMDVDRIHGKWLVNYWIADYAFRSLLGQQTGLGN